VLIPSINCRLLANEKTDSDYNVYIYNNLFYFIPRGMLRLVCTVIAHQSIKPQLLVMALISFKLPLVTGWLPIFSPVIFALGSCTLLHKIRGNWQGQCARITWIKLLQCNSETQKYVGFFFFFLFSFFFFVNDTVTCCAKFVASFFLTLPHLCLQGCYTVC